MKIPDTIQSKQTKKPDKNEQKHPTILKIQKDSLFLHQFQKMKKI